MNSKGVTFTFITILLISLILFSIFIHNNNASKTKIDKNVVRIETFNFFVTSLNKQYIHNEMKLSASKALASITQESESVKYINQEDFLADFQSLFLYGTLDGEELPHKNMTFENKEYYSFPTLMDKEIKSFALYDYGLKINPLVGNLKKEFPSDSFRDFLSSNIILEMPDGTSNLNMNLKMSYLIDSTQYNLNWTFIEKEFNLNISIEGYESIFI